MTDNLPEPIRDAFATAVAIAIAPEGADEVVQAIPADRLLSFIWVCDELIRRLNAAKKGALIEAQVAMSNGELPSIDLEVEGKKYQLRQDSRNDFDDPVNLAIDLHERGVPWSAILRAVGYFRVGDLQRAVGELEEDKREDAYGVLTEHRTKKSSGYALVNTDSPYRRRRAA